MNRTCLLKLASLLSFCFTSTATAAVTFDWVTVGDPGNLADTRIMDKGGRPDDTTGYGAVGYTYRIAEHHVTNSQYAEFLNAVEKLGILAVGNVMQPVCRVSQRSRSKWSGSRPLLE